jgi:hypothetical protein
MDDGDAPSYLLRKWMMEMLPHTCFAAYLHSVIVDENRNSILKTIA